MSSISFPLEPFSSALDVKHDREFDDVAWKRSDRARDEIEPRFRKVGTCEVIESLVEKYRGKRGAISGVLMKGSFNITYRVDFEERANDDRGAEDCGEKVIFRIPHLASIQFPEEKILKEVATMRYIAQKTTMPIPPVHY